MKFNQTILCIAVFYVSVSAVWAAPINVTNFGAVGNASGDNRLQIQNAIDSAATGGGGTVYFPAGYYNVSGTLSVPSNVRLQGMSSYYNCQIRQMTTGVPLFEVRDGASNITFKDLYLLSNSRGWRLTTPAQVAGIRQDGTTGISLKAADAGGISNIVIENVRIAQFNHGISATSSITDYDASISNVKIRNYASDGNEYALYTKTRGADLWDVQNLNVYPMYDQQNGIFLELSGRMSFLQLSCAGEPTLGNVCAKLWGNGDTYFRNMHVEGPKFGFCVGSHCDGSPGNRGENPSHLTVENSAAVGEFHRVTNLLSINNRIWLDHAGNPRYKFIGTGANSYLMSCGDVWTSGIDNPNLTTVIAPSNAYPGLATGIHGCVRGYLTSVPIFAQGYAFDNERLSGEADVTATAHGAIANDNNDDRPAFISALAAVNSSGANASIKRIYVPTGTYDISSTLPLSDGVSFVGEPGTVIRYTNPTGSLFKVVNAVEPVQGITWRNLVLTTTHSASTTGIEMENFSGPTEGAAADFQIQNVDFNNFKTGIWVHPFNTDDVGGVPNPMYDSISIKDADFNGNGTAILIRSENASNWNLENIRVNIPDDPNSLDGPGAKEGIRIDGIGLMSVR